MDRTSLSKRLALQMYASIDIGSNTVLLLVAEYLDGKFEIIHEEQRIPRLGKGVDGSGNLHSHSMKQVLAALGEYKQLLERNYQGIDPIVTATSAVRDAANRDLFVEQVSEETGFDVHVLSGGAEAKLTFSGALAMLPEINKGIVLDIGGGSTEVIVGQQKKITECHSFDMGSVRFTERYLKSDPPLTEEVNRCRSAVKAFLEEREFAIHDDFKIKKQGVIGVAGTVTSLAYIDSGSSTYIPGKLNGYTIDIEKVSAWVRRIASTTISDLKLRYPSVMEGRADVYLAGLIILETFMEFYGLQTLTVSTGGIRHGSIIQKAASEI